MTVTTASAPAAPIPVSDATFEEMVLASPLPVLVDFWAPWCGPCRAVAPTLAELAAERAGRLRIAKVNVDHDSRWAARLGVQGIPTLVLFRHGQELDRAVGAAPKASLLRWLDGALA